MRTARRRRPSYRLVLAISCFQRVVLVKPGVAPSDQTGKPYEVEGWASWICHIPHHGNVRVFNIAWFALSTNWSFDLYILRVMRYTLLAKNNVARDDRKPPVNMLCRK